MGKKIIIIVVFSVLIISIVTPAFSDEIDDIRELLSLQKGGDILYLSKINLGIPGGDNWIVNRGDRDTYIYTIGNGNEVKRTDIKRYVELSEIMYFDPDTRTNVNLEYDIMQYIPGTQIGDKAAKFGDYNADGKDEIISLDLTHEPSCRIGGYNNDKGVSYFYLHYDINSPTLPSPVGFYNYQGKYGIMNHLWDFMQERYIWCFSVWNEEEQKFEIIEEIGEEEIDLSQFTAELPDKKETATTVGVAVENEPSEEMETSTEEAIGQDSKFNRTLVITIGGLVVLLVAVAVLFMLRRKVKA